MIFIVISVLFAHIFSFLPWFVIYIVFHLQCSCWFWQLSCVLWCFSYYIFDVFIRNAFDNFAIFCFVCWHNYSIVFEKAQVQVTTNIHNNSKFCNNTIKLTINTTLKTIMKIMNSIKTKCAENHSQCHWSDKQRKNRLWIFRTFSTTMIIKDECRRTKSTDWKIVTNNMNSHLQYVFGECTHFGTFRAIVIMMLAK